MKKNRESNKKLKVRDGKTDRKTKKHRQIDRHTQTKRLKDLLTDRQRE